MSFIKTKKFAGCSLLTPIILATQEAEIRRIAVQIQPRQADSLWDPILKITHYKRAGGLAQGEGPEFKPQYHKKQNKKKQLRNSSFQAL
jgi:hypothetical protein